MYFTSKVRGKQLLSVTMAGRNSRGSRYQSRECIFCRADYWSEKCNAITDPRARREFLKTTRFVSDPSKNIIQVEIVRKKKLLSIVRDGLHNSAICIERNKRNGNQSAEAGNAKQLQILFLIYILCFCKQLTSLFKISQVTNK